MQEEYVRTDNSVTDSKRLARMPAIALTIFAPVPFTSPNFGLPEPSSSNQENSSSNPE